MLGTSAIPKLAINLTTASLRDTMLYLASEAQEWPCDEKELSEIVNTCIETKSKMSLTESQSMYFIHLLLHTALSFYELMLNEALNQDHAVLRMTLGYYIKILNHLTSHHVCTPAATHNFAKIRNAMTGDLDKLTRERLV